MAQITWKKTRVVPSEEYRKIFWAVFEYVKDKDFYYFVSDSRKKRNRKPGRQKIVSKAYCAGSSKKRSYNYKKSSF
ncbi:MAG: hypothetical protein JXR68_07680 [Bacteroidales bacterium]|nr:hypothetical protein [Bacteroidales bacterium]